MPYRLLALACGILAAVPAPTWATGRVEIVLVGESQLGGDFHQWVRVLGNAGAANVQVRTGEPGTRPAIEIRGTADRPVYLVTGTVTPRGELLLPGARFQRSDASRLAQWIKDLAEGGPPGRREATTAFGLTATQFQRVHDDLAQLPEFSTAGRPRSEVVQRIARRLAIPLRADAEVLKALGEDKLAEELSGLSCGTALAYTLRPMGFCLAPRPAGRDVHYAILPAKDRRELWPVRWEPQKPAREVLPALFEFLTVNIQNVPASTAMDAIAKRLGVPMLLDHSALARHGIEPEKATVALPSGKTTHSMILGKVLFRAGLKYELRVDEAEHPFLWVTTVKPL